jgi:hypothetical protein
MPSLAVASAANSGGSKYPPGRIWQASRVRGLP